jgi:hypothetical protein
MTAKETVKTNKPIGTQAPTSGKLQRLGFVPQIGQAGLDVAGSLYSYTKSWVPKQLKPTVEQGEEFYAKHGQPIVGSFANLGNEILLLVDGQVQLCSSLCQPIGRQLEAPGRDSGASWKLFWSLVLQDWQDKRLNPLKITDVICVFKEKKGLMAFWTQFFPGFSGGFEAAVATFVLILFSP